MLTHRNLVANIEQTLARADIGDEDEVSNEFTDLGRTHRSLGVHRGDFTPMEEALIDTLRIELGDEFTEDLERAWRAAFEEVSARMIGRGDIPD